MIRHKRLIYIGLAVVISATIALAGCRHDDVGVGAEERVLERERAALERYLAEADEGPLVQFDGLLVVVKDQLVRQVVETALPFRTTVGERYVLDLAEADVRFRSGLALVRLHGRASLVGRPDVYADLTVVGSFRVIGLDPDRSTLQARVEVLGFDTRKVEVGGMSPPVRRLINGLAAYRTAELSDVLGTLDIPILLREEIELPAVAESEVTISASALPLRLEVTSVKVLVDRLWISVSADVGRAAVPAGWGAPHPGISARGEP